MKINSKNANRTIQLYESDNYKDIETLVISLKDNFILNTNLPKNVKKELAVLGYFIIKGYKQALAIQVKKTLYEGASRDEILKVLAFVIGNLKRFECAIEVLNVLSYEENASRDYISLSDDLGEKYTINKNGNNGKEVDNLKIAIISGNNISLRVKQAVESGLDKKQILKIASDVLELYKIKDKIYGPENRNPIKPSPEEIKINIEEKLKKYLISKKFKDFMAEINRFEFQKRRILNYVS